MTRITPVDRRQLDTRADEFAELVMGQLARVALAAAARLADEAPVVAAAGGVPPVSLDSLTVIGAEWSATVDGQLLPVAEQLYTGASLAWTLAARTNIPGWDTAVIPPVSSQATAAYLATARNRLVNVGNELWSNARASLLEGFAAGESIPELADRVSAAAGVTGPRATVIARTEVVSASNLGSIDVARSLDLPMDKVWLATPDGRTRPSHAEADGQQVPLSEPFTVGGASLDEPGDPYGPAEEVVSCRCSIGYELPDDVPPPDLDADLDDADLDAALVAAGKDPTMPTTTTGSLLLNHWSLHTTGPQPAPLTAAAGDHTGAMIALVPAQADVDRLALDGGEPADQLHVTLFYLGEAADFDDAARQQLAEAVQQATADLPPVACDAFAVSAFNPGEVNDRECALVLGLSGAELDAAHAAALAAVDTFGGDMPEQHAPWQPHLTVAYSDDLSLLTGQLLDRLGPVTFDRVRLAFAGETTDIPLAGEHPAAGEGSAAASPAADTSPAASFGAVGPHDTGTSDEAWDGPANEARLPSPMSMGTARAAYAWIDEGEAEDGQIAKAACKFIHHNVSADGTPGAANLTACSAAIGVLNGGRGGADIPAADRQGVYNHVAKHLRDAGREPAPLAHNQDGEQAADGSPQLTDLSPDPGSRGPFLQAGPELVDVAKLRAARVAQQPVTLQAEGECPPGQHPMPDGTCMPDEEMPDDEQVGVVAGEGGEHFHTLMIVEGVSTGLRTFAEGALSWRTPPFSFRWQEREPEFGGHANAVGVGNVERVERVNGVEIHGWGRLDLDDEDGLEFARKLAAGFAPWVSIGLDESLRESDIELVFPDDGEDDDDDEEAGGLPLEALFMEPEQVIFHAGRIAELTAVTVPAQAEARVEALPALYEALAQRGIQVEEAPATQRAVVVASAGTAADEVATITVPYLPPAHWFDEPTDVTPLGAMTITDEGRIYGWLATDGVAHRAYRDRRVEAPMGRVDYSRWMGGEALVAGGGRVVAGPVTMECGHLPPTASRSPEVRMEHYDNACSVVAKARVGESFREIDGVTRRLAWIAGALEPWVTGDQISRMLACRLSGDWAPHPERRGWQELVAMLVVPVPGFANPRTGPSVRVRDGALVASAVPIRLAGAAPAGPDTRPVLERLARQIGRDGGSRLKALHARVHHSDNGHQKEVTV